MKQRIQTLTALLLVALLLLSACGVQGELSENGGKRKEPLSLTVAIGGVQETLVPTYSTAEGSETILFHLYENLMRWEDNGDGYATLAPGQAESYTIETDYAGNVTYTFTLREDIVWSDGQSVTASHFVAAWQRLADPAYDSPHRDLLHCIAGYEEVQTTGDASLLGVSASDARTLVVKLNGSVPHFLRAVCASAYTMPIRTYLPDNEIVTNGAYTVAEYSSTLVKLVKSEKYYDRATVKVAELCFVPAVDSEGNYTKWCDGELDFIESLPLSARQDATVSHWEPVTATYAVLFHTLQPPFDNADIRTAFRLAVDEQAVVDALADYIARPAIGLLPYGVADYGPINKENTVQPEEENKLPDPNAPMPTAEEDPGYYDFRAHGAEIVTLDIGEGDEVDCAWARTLLSNAGYADGKEFPAVEYLYINTSENEIVARTLQSAWQTVLGVTVQLRAVSVEEYRQILSPSSEESTDEDEENEGEIASPAFQMVGMTIADTQHDPYAFLSRWHSESTENIGGYSSAAFDILINAAKAAVTPESYDAYLHDAEAILMQDAPVIPVFYYGDAYALADDLAGFYCAPNGIYFFSHVTGKNAK